jgi:tetratricopeptide (TPR) repeat protein
MQVTKQSLRERQIAVIYHYLARLEEICHTYTQGGVAAQEALRRFDLEWQQLKVQQQSASRIATYDLEAASLVVAFPVIAKPLLTQIDVEEALIWLNDAYAHLGPDENQKRYDVKMMIYELCKTRLDPAAMRETLNELETLSDRLDDDRRRIRVACLNAEYYEPLYQYEDQLAWAESALTRALHIEEPTLIAEALHLIGVAKLRLNKTVEARDVLHQSLGLYQSLARRGDEVKVRSALALNAYYAMEFEDALRMGEQARAIASEIGDRTREVRLLSNLSLFANGAGDFQKSIEYGQKAWLMASDKGLLNAVWTALGSMVMTLGVLGLAEEMEEYIGYIHASIPYSAYMEDVISSERAKVAYEYEDWQTSIQISAEYALTDQEPADLDLEYGALLCWGLSLIALMRWDEAVEPLLRGRDFHYLRTDNSQIMSGILACLSFVQAKRGQWDDAKNLLDQFFGLNLESDFSKVTWKSECLCLVYETTLMLGDDRSALIKQRIKADFEISLNKLTDEKFRASYLNMYTTRQMRVIAGL